MTSALLAYPPIKRSVLDKALPRIAYAVTFNIASEPFECLPTSRKRTFEIFILK